MRSSFELLRDSPSPFKRLAYGFLRCCSKVMNSHRREVIRCWFYRVTKLRPSFCRRMKKWGLCKTPRSPRIIVSLTSYPKRIKTVHRTIETLLTQTFKPDMVVLWLGEEKFPNKEADLPRKLLRLKEFGLTIGWCRDIRSYTKLVPALKAYPDDIIVTADDDVFYHPEWLARLYASYRMHPDAVHCHLVNEIKIENGAVRPYAEWRFIKNRGEISRGNLLMGVGGVLYPPHVLADEVADETKFLSLAPAADDLWFWAMVILNGRSIKLAEDAFTRITGDCAADDSEALMNIDVAQGQNDVQLAKILEAYPVVKERLFAAKEVTKLGCAEGLF